MKYLLLIGIFGLLAFSYARDQNMNQLSNEELSDGSKMLYGFIAREGKQVGKKYGMSLCSVGGGAKKDGIWLISFDFQHYGAPLNEEEARRLIIKCLHDYLEAVNRDDKLKPFLKVYPFTAKNIKMGIFNSTTDREDIFHPYIGLVKAIEGKIGYFTDDALAPNQYKSEKYETYDEAIAILQKEKERTN